MKKIIFSLTFFITAIVVNAQSPTLAWAKNFGGNRGYVYGKSITTDLSGNVYTTGYFTGSVDFDPGSGIFNLIADGAYGVQDIFVSKSDASGNFIWAKKMGGTSNKIGNSVYADASGNVYITGNFQGTTDFDPGAGVFNLTSAGVYDIFVLKLNAAGNFMWAKKMGGALADEGISIAVDGSGNVYTTGSFRSSADFDPGVGIFNLTTIGNAEIFISKLDASGNFVWAKSTRAFDLDFAFAYSIVLDAAGYVYSTGSFYGQVDFDPGADTFDLISSGFDIFVSKLDASGNFVWAKKMGGSSTDEGFAITLDPSGYVYTTGYFKGTADFNPGAGTFNMSTSFSSIEDIFISKLDTSGNFVWAKKMTGSGSPNRGLAIAIDGSGNVYTTGTFQGTNDFDPGAATFNLVSAGFEDIFISKLDVSGNFVWAKKWGAAFSDYGNSIALDAAGNVYSTGAFKGTTDFDPGTGIYNLSFIGDVRSIFISKLNTTGNLAWVKKLGEISSAIEFSSIVDGSGNIYSTGYFAGTVDFDPGAGYFSLTTSGSTDIFISKLDASGNFVWAKQTGGILNDKGQLIKIDGAGNVFILGAFMDTVDFDPGPATFNLISAGNDDLFILKLDNSGNFVWAKNSGGIAPYGARSIITDPAGNIYIAGSFQGTTDFDPGAGIFNLTSAGISDIFISKLNSSGNFIWVKQMGGTSGDNCQSISLDASGNIYTIGSFSGTADFDPGAGTYNLTSVGGNNQFISKLDASGNFVWAKQMENSSAVSGNGIAIDAAGNVYTTGAFSGTADFDPGTGITNLIAGGNGDVFILKLDASGNFVWAKSMGGTQSEGATFITLDVSGNIYIDGNFQGTGDFDPGPGTFNLTSAGSVDYFALKINNSGNFVWAISIGGPDGEYGGFIGLDVSGNVYCASYFYGTADFDPDASGTFYLSPSGYPDTFIQKMSQCAPPSAIITPGGTTSFCSGGSVILSANSGTGFNYQWKKNGTDISGATNQNYTAIASGSYSVVITNACGTAASSSVSVTVNSLPSATITSAGPTTFCSGSSVVLNAVVAANRTYQWKKNNANISGATLSSYTATTTGNYKVVVTNTQTGCSKTTAAATVVTVNAKPAATITPQGPTSFCAGGSVVLAANTGTGLTYKWKKGSNFISGATLSNYTAITAGTYRVEVTNSNGCSKLSAGVTVTVPCKLSENVQMDSFGESKDENVFDVKVYPNPNSGEFTIKFLNKPISLIQIELTDEIGKVVKRFETNNETVVIKESNLAKGIYCLTARNNNEVIKKKINIVN